MMKFWSRLCFLVLAISSISSEQTGTTVPPGSGNEDPATLHEPQNEATGTPPPSASTPSAASPSSASLPPASPQNHTTTANATDLTLPVSRTQEVETTDPVSPTTSEEVTGSTAAQATASGGSTWRGGGYVSMTTTPPATSISPTPGASHSSWGYVILVFIVLVIIVLCIILYYLRRASGTYSFDLQRHVASNHLNEPIGTFEPVYLDDLDRPPSKDRETGDDFSHVTVSNGTALQSEERGSSGESGCNSLHPINEFDLGYGDCPPKLDATQEEPDTNSPESLPTSNTSNTSPSLGDDPAEKTPSPLDIFFDATGEEQQNENNNNPSVCSRDPFVEINLDEPAWCDQLLNSPEDTSSVFPFSPFSFSSSSSSSSS